MKQLMRAVIYDKPGPPEVLKIGERKKQFLQRRKF
jgi:hypothetical protein